MAKKKERVHVVVPLEIRVTALCENNDLDYNALRQYKVIGKKQHFIMSRDLAKKYLIDKYIQE